MTSTPINIQRTSICNEHDFSLKVYLEPWGNRWELAPNDQIEFEFEGPPNGSFEVHNDEQDVVVTGWSGSTVRTKLRKHEPACREFALPSKWMQKLWYILIPWRRLADEKFYRKTS